MIYQLCNHNNEQIDTFFKVAVIKKEALSNFTHLDSDETIETIITSLPDSADVFIIDLLPENLRLTSNTKINASGKNYPVKAGFVVTPQDKNLQQLLETYNNQEVVLLLDQHTATYIYGTPLQPLLFKYSELHSSKASGLKGYSIDIDGDSYGAVKLLENIELNIFSRGLAFELAGSL